MEAAKVGVRIQEVRRARGLTQAELAQAVDITPKYLSNIECGAKIPKFETFIAIANALEIDANTLLVDVLTVSNTIISTEISDGETPEILDACPTECGCTAFNFCTASVRRLCTSS